MQKSESSWIFLSHSSQDIEKIRIIRNEFEKYGQNPLAFHLKCLNTDTVQGRDEIDNLIKREIQAREWFVYCQSDSARKSPYVNMERAYILEIGKKKVWTIDLAQDMELIKNQVKLICQDIEVFITYSRKDYDLCKMLAKELRKKDFYVWMYDENDYSESWIEYIADGINNASKKGFVVAMITENSVKSRALGNELQLAVRNSSTSIVPIIFGDIKLPMEIEFMVGNIQFRLPKNPNESDMKSIAEQMERMVIDKISKHRH